VWQDEYEKFSEPGHICGGGGDVKPPLDIGRERQEDPRMAFAGALRIKGVQRDTGQAGTEAQEGRHDEERSKDDQGSGESLKSPEESTPCADVEGDKWSPFRN
jgi:hypothetical protein